MKTILVTGGAGFIGSNLVRMLLETRDDCRVVNADALTYAGNLESLSDIEDDPRYEFVRVDLADAGEVKALFESHSFDWVMHLAAESHVDRSILEPTIFITSNVLGTQNLLDAAREHGVEKYLQVSTDEVYGTLGATGAFTEQTPIQPNSPYSASKAGSDLLVRAAFETHGMPVVTTRCSNNYGPYQFPEKLIPLMIGNAMADHALPVYGDGRQIRDWLHVSDHCRALIAAVEHGKPGAVYNIGGNSEMENIEVVRILLRHLGKSDDLIRHVDDRPGHDRRYAIDATFIRDELGWEPVRRFDEALDETIRWYRENQDWCERVRSGAYREYYERQYGSRLA